MYQFDHKYLVPIYYKHCISQCLLIIKNNYPKKQVAANSKYCKTPQYTEVKHINEVA